MIKKLLEYFSDCLKNVDEKGQNILHMAVKKDWKEV